MKLLTFRARRFAWTPYEATISDAPEAESGEVSDAVVAYLHVESADVSDSGRARALRKSAKQLKWIAGKVGFRQVVLHSFTHLGGDTADADRARAFLHDLAAKLRNADYDVAITPFGWLCEWSLDVRGESMAKVWAEF